MDTEQQQENGVLNESNFLRIYFALHFAMIFLGLVIAIYTDMTWIGLALSFVIMIKFMLMLPDLNERTDI